MSDWEKDRDEKIKTIIDQYLSQPKARMKLAQAMTEPLRMRRYPIQICPECGKDISGVLEPILHTDEACCIYKVMES